MEGSDSVPGGTPAAIGGLVRCAEGAANRLFAKLCRRGDALVLKPRFKRRDAERRRERKPKLTPLRPSASFASLHLHLSERRLSSRRGFVKRRRRGTDLRFPSPSSPTRWLRTSAGKQTHPEAVCFGLNPSPAAVVWLARGAGPRARCARWRTTPKPRPERNRAPPSYPPRWPVAKGVRRAPPAANSDTPRATSRRRADRIPPAPAPVARDPACDDRPRWSPAPA